MPGEQSRINGRKGGRPKGSENKETKMKRAIRKTIVEYVFENKEHLVEKLDEKHLALLINQAIGKPPESLKVFGDAENPVRVIKVKRRERRQPRD